MCSFCDHLATELEVLPIDVSDDSYLVKTLRRVGKRLEKAPGDNYALRDAMAAILNLKYIDEQNGGHRYEKYYPEYSPRAGKQGIKRPDFASENFCQSQKDEEKRMRVIKTEKGVVLDNKKICGKPWTCPVCGAKIAARRNERIHKILKKAYAEGKSVFLITFTAPHTADYSILGFSKKLQQAREHFSNSRDWKMLKKKYGHFGYIKTMETMLGGPNGAHNHFHELHIWDAIFNKETGAQTLRKQILNIWAKSCIKFGLLDPNNEAQLAFFREHAIDVKQDFDPDYMSKQSDEWKREHKVSESWGAAEEITLSRMKKGQGSFTPLGYVATICKKVAANGYKSITDLMKDCDLFIEYACAMAGRKQFQASPGLEAWAELDEKTDEELATEMEDKEDEVIASIDTEQYAFIRRNYWWKEMKKALFEDTEKAVAVINKVFIKYGLQPLYGAQDKNLYNYDDDLLSELPDDPPSEIGEVRPPESKTPPTHKMEQGRLFD